MTNKSDKNSDKTRDDKNVPEGIREGIVRVVTEADILGDSRLVAASVVVGQLYDFSNLDYVKDNAIEHDVERYNQTKADAGQKENIEDTLANRNISVQDAELSKAERIEMGLEADLK